MHCTTSFARVQLLTVVEYLCRTVLFFLQAIERIKQELVSEDPVKQVTLEYMQLDLSSFQSTKDFISAFKEKNLSLNILINNAGIAWVPFSKCLWTTLEHASSVFSRNVV